MSKVKKVKLEEITTNFDKLRIPLSSSERSKLNKIYPYYGAQSIVDYVDKYLFDGEYLLVAEDGENLKSQNSNVCNYVKGKFWVNNHAHILQAKDDNNLKYIYYLLNLKDFRPYVTGSAQPKLTQDNLNKMVLLIHEPCDQIKIATVLSSLDDKIELNNRINAELEQMAKTIYDYWFVQFDFPISAEYAESVGQSELEGKPYKSSGGKMVWSDELKREVPEGWEVRPLSYFSDKIGDGIHGTPQYIDDSDYNFINGNNLKNGFIVIENETKKVSVSEYEKYFIDLNEGTILMSINGTLGNLAVYTGEKIMLGKSSAYINCKSNYRPYCYQYLKSESIQKKMWNIATGSTIKNLSLDSIKNLSIPYPGNNLIKCYYDYAKLLDEKRINIFKENQKLTELRDWLLPMLMNGQVKVGDVDDDEMTGIAAEPMEEYKVRGK